MITNLLLEGLTALLTGFIGLFPTGDTLDLTAKMTALGGDQVFQYLGWLNNYMPIEELTTALGIIAVLIPVAYALYLALWLYNHIPGLGGSSEGGSGSDET